MATEVTTKIFAFIVDNDVIGTIHIPSDAPNYDRLVAGLSSDPIVLETTDTPDVKFGWIFDGTNFSEPSE